MRRPKPKPRTPTLQSVTRAQIKQLRSDARKLSVIVNHLRAQAQALADEIRAEERAERARTNFYSKPAKIDEGITLTPDYDPATALGLDREENTNAQD